MLKGGDPKDKMKGMDKGKGKGKGKGWHGDPEEHARVGQMGGTATLDEYGEEFYSEIGQMGGEVSPGNFRNNPERAREAGKKGGKSRGKRGR